MLDGLRNIKLDIMIHIPCVSFDTHLIEKVGEHLRGVRTSVQGFPVDVEQLFHNESRRYPTIRHIVQRGTQIQINMIFENKHDLRR